VLSSEAKELLRDGELKRLFISEMGWDRYSFPGKEIEYGGVAYPTLGIAQKRGFAVVAINLSTTGMPDRNARRAVDKLISAVVREHIVVFLNSANKVQLWQWAKREPGRPVKYREHLFDGRRSGDGIFQKLERLVFSIEEEESLAVATVARRARHAFDLERVTKRFYERFKKEHGIFLDFIEGIADQSDCEWYASVMLNRLMFVYFIQRKGFLDGDRDYLRNRWKSVRAQSGAGQFHSFYRYFLLRLFHEALGNEARSAELERLVGQVPYLNGGLFDIHDLERRHEDGAAIHIPDEAFERIFNYFDEYEWHLDERPLRAENEINPDVLGYIFEKYINQKQMGAYYTKEDITEYIGRSAIVPFVLDSVRAKCPSAFTCHEDGKTIWELLRSDPGRYIYPSVRHGISWDCYADGGRGAALDSEVTLPAEITAGIEVATRDSLVTLGSVKTVELRKSWNRAAPEPYALPAETWRDVVTRRERYEAVRKALAGGEVRSIDDLITLNLDVRQFLEDVIDDAQTPEMLEALWSAISRLTVLDPTCGSGAFLFAALNILEPLYEACIERMEAFLAEAGHVNDEKGTQALAEFRTVSAQIDGHPNRRYFILKTIILNNLFGVDIMEEAVEICKLRLFLKLAAQVEVSVETANLGIEPLPDIDFNVRAGNTLVGYATLEDAKGAVASALDFENTAERLSAEAQHIQRSFDAFRASQIIGNSDHQRAIKQELRQRLKALQDTLNGHLAAEYGIKQKECDSYRAWLSTTLPFHWFLEFYGIIETGGFDVIIGNPPYLEYSKVDDYRVKGYITEKCANLYAFVVERCFRLIDAKGRVGVIVPISIACSGAMDPLRAYVWGTGRSLWFSHFSNRPGQLFVGAQSRVTILLASSALDSALQRFFSTRYYRWDAKRGERENLFPTLEYFEASHHGVTFHGMFPKIGRREAASVLSKISSPSPLGVFESKRSKFPIYWVRVPGYFCIFLEEPPMARPEKGGKPRIRGEVNSIHMVNESDRHVVHAVLNSSTYYQFFCVYTDTRHINPSDVRDFPLDLKAFGSDVRPSFRSASRKLAVCFRENTGYWRKSGLLIDSVDARPCKEAIDEIDHLLGAHYGFTEDELDFIINYDIKYRVGDDPEAQES
jgi:uncharacterized protein YukE